METGRSWYVSANQEPASEGRPRAERQSWKENRRRSRPFSYKIVRHDLREGGKRRWRIVGEELEPAEAEAIKEAAARVLRGESLRSIAMDRNERGVKTVGGCKWQGSLIRRVLIPLGSQALKSNAARSSARPRGRRSSTAPPVIDWSGC
jgi:hypothetical protein